MLELALSNWPIIASADIVLAVITHHFIKLWENKKLNYYYPEDLSSEYAGCAFKVLKREDRKILLEFRQTNSNFSNSRKKLWFADENLPLRYISTEATFTLRIKEGELYFSDFSIEDYDYLDRKWLVENF